MKRIEAEEIIRELSETEHGLHGAVINRYAQLYNCSKGTIYRALRRERGAIKSVKREKKIPDNIIDEIAKMKMRGKALGLSERELSTELCIEQLKIRGYKEAETLTVPTVNRRLKERGFRQREIIVRVEASYPNQQHQLDFSRSEYFQVWKYDSAADDYLLRIKRQLFYKEDERKLRTWIVNVIDSFSRIGVARAYAATGESISLGIKFLNYAYNGDNEENPLGGYLPEILKTDNGAFAKSKAVKNMLRALEIKSEFVIPYKKRGIQKGESFWKLIWRRFELPLALKLGEGATIHLSDYNELLAEFAMKNAEADHPVRPGTKGHNYLSGLAATEPRKISVDLRDVAFVVYERRVSDACTVSIDKQLYEAPPYTVGKKIEVYSNYAGEFVGELKDEFSKPFTLKPTRGFVELGDFEHRAHAGYLNEMEREIKAEDKAEVEAKAKAKAKAKVEGRIQYMPPREREYAPETKFTRAAASEDYEFPSVYKAKAYIGGRLPAGVNYADVKDIFDILFEGEDPTLAKSDIDEVLNNYLGNKKRAII